MSCEFVEKNSITRESKEIASGRIAMRYVKKSLSQWKTAKTK